MDKKHQISPTSPVEVGGIIFQIEQDALQPLTSYMQDLQRCFSEQEDKHLVLHDIENRMAELFLAKNKHCSPVLNLSDIEFVRQQIGSASEIAKEMGIAYNAQPEREQKWREMRQKTEGSNAPTQKKRLTLSRQYKRIGGVASGLANYLGVHPFWIRALFILTLPLKGAGLLAYLSVWAVAPKANPTETEPTHSPFYRNIMDKKIGGVAAGIATYFNLDTTWVRLAFVASIFFQVGIPLYLVLWLMMPAADSLAAHSEMQGAAFKEKHNEKAKRYALSFLDNVKHIFSKS
ncbi:MAG: PspC domain-containing protein [Bernardetiaceae bacterium]|nr:PspC domain-containing protein [Bernardetiaceae bacterium]